MRNDAREATFLRQRRRQIREGLAEGVRREVERCRRLGLPLYVSRGNGVEVIRTDTPDDEAVEDPS